MREVELGSEADHGQGGPVRYPVQEVPNGVVVARLDQQALRNGMLCRPAFEELAGRSTVRPGFAAGGERPDFQV
jgi:hypothetical protein